MNILNRKVLSSIAALSLCLCGCITTDFRRAESLITPTPKLTMAVLAAVEELDGNTNVTDALVLATVMQEKPELQQRFQNTKILSPQHKPRCASGMPAGWLVRLA